jgi:hypothetical protein
LMVTMSDFSFNAGFELIRKYKIFFHGKIE